MSLFQLGVAFYFLKFLVLISLSQRLHISLTDVLSTREGSPGSGISSGNSNNASPHSFCRMAIRAYASTVAASANLGSKSKLA